MRSRLTTVVAAVVTTVINAVPTTVLTAVLTAILTAVDKLGKAVINIVLKMQ